MTIPGTIDAILDEQYRQHQERINRATDREIDVACRRAVERFSDRPAKDTPPRKSDRYGRAA